MTGQTPQDGDALREEHAMLLLEREHLQRMVEETELKALGMNVELEHADLAARLTLELTFVQDPEQFGDKGTDALRELVAKGREAMEEYRRDMAASEGEGDDGEYEHEDDAAYHAHLQDMLDLAQAELDR